MTLKILSTHAFDTEIAIIIILHKFKTNWSKFVIEFNGIPYPRNQAHRANHLEKIHFTKAPLSVFKALRQEMVIYLERQGQQASNDDMLNSLKESTSPSK